MKITIIVPVYKVEKSLRRCLDSIINQTHTNIEIILVDDGSPDNCPLICDEYAKKDNRIKVIHKDNGGLSDARNKGIDMATGEYIMFVDSDDTINISACEELSDIFKREEPDIICFNLNNVSEENNKNLNNKFPFCYENTKKIVDLTYNEAIIDNIYRKHIRYEAPSKIYKKRIFENNKFPNGLLAEDFATFYKFLKEANKIIYYDSNLYNYYQRKNSIMNKRESKLYADIYNTEKEFYKEVIILCNKELDKKQNENRHCKLLLKIYAKIFYDNKYQKEKNEIFEDLRKVNYKWLNKKTKILYKFFFLNPVIFVNLFSKIYKKA